MKLFLVVGIIAGIVTGGTICYVLFGRKTANEVDENAKQQYEKDIIRLETSLVHANKEVEERKRLIVEKEREQNETNRKLNEALTSLSVAEERLDKITLDYKNLIERAAGREVELTAARENLSQVSSNLSVIETRFQNISSDYNNLVEKAERQETELTAARENVAQLSANTIALENNLADKIKANNLKEIENLDLTKQIQNLFGENATLAANLTSNEVKLAVHKAEIEDIREKSHFVQINHRGHS